MYGIPHTCFQSLQWIIENKGIDTEDDYPYTAEDGTCSGKKKNRHVVTIDGYEVGGATRDDRAQVNRPR